MLDSSFLLIIIAVAVLLVVTMSIALEWCHKYSWELIFDEKFQYDPSHENDYDEEEVSTDCGAERGSTGLEHMVIDEVAKGSTTPAQDLGDMINSQIEHSPSSPQREEVKETDEILERTSMEEKCRNIVTDMRNLQKNGDEEEEEESTECGAKSGSTGLEHMVIDKVAKGSTTPAQDLGNMINSQIEHSPSSSQGEEVKETDEILERTSMEEKCRNIVMTDMRNLQKNDEEEESTERGAKSETGHEVAEGFTSVQDAVDINQQNESTSNQGEELVLRDQGDELNLPERTLIMEEKWMNIVKEVLPEETVVPLEAVPKEVMVQLLKVVDKLQVSLDRLKTNQDHSIWAPTWSELDALQPSSWMKMKTTPFNNDQSSGSEDACNC